jgi:hypothetical protein
MSEIGVEPRAQDIVRELEAVLGRRIDELERENQKLRRLGTLMVGVFGVMLLITSVLLVSMRMSAGAVPEVVEANRFIVRDADGHIRAIIGLSADGASRIVLQDRDARERLRLSLLPDGSPGMSFTDREGRSRAVLGLLPDETATLVFADRYGKSRAVLGLSPDESSTLVFADRNGEARVGLGIESDGSAGVTMFDREPAPPPVPAAANGEPEAAATEPAGN